MLPVNVVVTLLPLYSGRQYSESQTMHFSAHRDGHEPEDASRLPSEDGQSGTVFGLLFALFRRLPLIVGVALAAGLTVYVVGTFRAPAFISEAQILVENQEDVYTRPTVDGGRVTDGQTVVDTSNIRSQVQLLQSIDVARAVAERLDLAQIPEFDPLLNGQGVVSRGLVMLGFASDPNRKTPQERVLAVIRKKLDVFPVEGTRVINVRFSSRDPQLAADIVNTLVDEYMLRQREAKQNSTREATEWLAAQIETLRNLVTEAEQRVADYRSESGLLIGSNNTTLNAQQLSELNSQLILAQTRKSDAQARAQSIRAMLSSGREIDTASDVLESQLLSRLQERLISLRADRAELLATLLPGHPRVQQIDAEIRGLNDQIRGEMGKIAESLESEAELSGAREASIRANLEALKAQVSDTTVDEVELRALEREAKAQRDFLESLLARYGEATARQDPTAAVPDARIISRPVASNTPAMPDLGILVIGAMAFAALVTIGLISMRQLMLYAASIDRAPGHQISRDPVATPIVATEPEMPGVSADRLAMAAETIEKPIHNEPATMFVDQPAALEDRESGSADDIDATGPDLDPTLPEPVNGLLSSGRDMFAAVVDALTDGKPATMVVAPEADGVSDIIALALGRAVAREGHKVLVVDAVAGEPSNEGRPGFWALLTGQAKFAQAIFCDAQSPAHRIGADVPAEIAEDALAERFRLMVDALSQTYDLVVVAVRPAKSADDAKILARHVDQSVVVAMEGNARSGADALKEELVACGADTVFCYAPDGVGPSAEDGQRAA